VLQVNRDTGKVLVEHVGMIKRHTRPNPQKQIKGGIAERESPINASNVMVVCPQCHKATRIGHHVDAVAGGKTRRTRVCKKCGQTLDRK
jgi:large subunit ribosomal protein L24